MFRSQLRCSFCGRHHSEVAKLVSGRQAYICDQCIAVAHRVANDPHFTPPRVTPTSLSLWRRLIAKVMGMTNHRRATSPRANHLPAAT